MCENLSQVGSRPIGNPPRPKIPNISRYRACLSGSTCAGYILVAHVNESQMYCPTMACAATGPCARSGGEGAAHGSGDEGQGAGSKCHGRAGLRTPHSS